MDTNGSFDSHSFPNHSSSRVSDTMNVEAVQDCYCNTLFINYAAVAWHEMRRAWRGEQTPVATKRMPRTDTSTAYHDLLSSNEPFDEPVPLAEMVEFLVGIWEED